MLRGREGKDAREIQAIYNDAKRRNARSYTPIVWHK
jgi:hypothetical protein